MSEEKKAIYTEPLRGPRPPRASLQPRGKTPWILAAILLVAAVLRIACLLEAPPGFFQDEAATGYDAYCLSLTGMNRHGQVLPIFFYSFGDYEEGLHRYLVVPFIWFLGLSVWSVRLVSAVLGVGVVGMTFLLGRLLYGNTGGLAAAAISALTPWQIHLSRVAVRDILLPLVFGLGTFLVIQAFRERSRRNNVVSVAALLAGGFALWALTFYTYTVARLFVPLMVLGFILIYRDSFRELWRNQKIVLFPAAGAFILVSVPLALEYILHPEHMNARLNVITVDQSGTSLFSLSNLVRSVGNYLPHYSPDHLFISGDPNPFLFMGGGLLLPSLAPFLILGLWMCIAAWRSREARLLLLWLLVYPIPDCITPGGPHAHRCVTAIPIYALVCGAGFLVMVSWIRSPLQPLRILGWAVCAVVAAGTMWGVPRQAHAYISEIPKQTYAFYYDGLEDAIGALRELEPKRPLTVMTDTINQSHIFYLFHTAYPPGRFHLDRRALDMEPDEEWLYVTGFNRYLFVDPELEAPPNSIVLATALETGFVRPLATIPSQSGTAWTIADGTQLVQDAWLEGERRVLRLRRCEVSRSVAAPEEAFQVRFMWRCLEQPSEDLKVIMRFEGGDFSWKADHKWWYGSLPANEQPRGRIMPWGQRVFVPQDAPNGVYAILIGVQGDTGQLLRRGDGRYFQEVGTIRVGDPPPKLMGEFIAAWIEQDVECFVLENVGTSRDSAAPGEKLRLTFDWRCLKPPEENLRVIVHLVSGDNQLVFDHDFLDESFDPESITPGEMYTEKKTIRIPEDAPPGKYVLEIGLWNPRWYYDLLTRNGDARAKTLTINITEK